MLPRSYRNPGDDAIACLDRLLAAARRRRLALGAECEPLEAERRETAAAAAAIMAAVGLLAAEGVRR